MVEVSREAGTLNDTVGRTKEEFDAGIAPPVLATKVDRGAVLTGVVYVALGEKVDATPVERVIIETGATAEDVAPAAAVAVVGACGWPSAYVLAI